MSGSAMIIGLGKTGKAVADFYKRIGYELYLCDIKSEEEFSQNERTYLMERGRVVFGDYPVK